MRDYDRYENESGFEKFTHRKKTKHRKGHQSRHGSRFDSLDLFNDDLEYSATAHYLMSQREEPSIEKKNTPNFPEMSNFTFGPNTREIQGVKIDYDRVIDIRKVENMKDQTMTYGIKYFFTGDKGLYRIIWFNIKIKVRDSVFATEYKFWKNLINKKEKE